MSWTLRPLRPILVGQAPGPGGVGPAGPLVGGRVGRRLADAAGLTEDQFAATFERWNLLDAWPGRAGEKGDLFPRGAASAAAERLLPMLDGHHVVLLGWNVERAFGLGIDAPMVWRQHEWRSGEMLVAVLPHPSGVNLWWNDAGNVERARAFLSGLARSAEVRRG